MKKLMMLAITLLTAVAVKAQQYPPPRYYPAPRRVQRRPVENRRVDDFYRVKFGVVAGVNVANLVNVNHPNFGTNTIAGLNIGGSLDLPVVRPLALELEVLYSQKGYSGYTSDGSFTQRNNFIDVPLLAKFRLAPAFNFLIGPQISFLTSTQNTYHSGFATSSETIYNSDANGFNKSVIGGVVGVGIDLSPNVELRGRYTLDLQDNTSDGVTYPNYRNQVWQIGLGFKF